MKELTRRLSNPNVALAILAFWFVMLGNAVFPVIRTTVPALNYFIFAVVAFLPFHVLYVADEFQGWKRKFIKISSGILILPSFVLSLGSAGCGLMSLDGDASAELIEERKLDGGRIVVYRTNGGATTSYGIQVNQECSIVPGIKTIRYLDGEYPADNVEIEHLTDGVLQFKYPPYGTRRPEATTGTARLRWACWGWAV